MKLLTFIDDTDEFVVLPTIDSVLGKFITPCAFCCIWMMIYDVCILPFESAMLEAKVTSEYKEVLLKFPTDDTCDHPAGYWNEIFPEAKVLFPENATTSTSTTTSTTINIPGKINLSLSI